MWVQTANPPKTPTKEEHQQLFWIERNLSFFHVRSVFAIICRTGNRLRIEL